MNMDQIGALIKKLRIEKEMTQKELANLLNITEQAISKWERGLGLPDISFLPHLSRILEVNLNEMLQGNLQENENQRGIMKNIHFYICSQCDNLILSAANASISCCGRTVTETQSQEAKANEKMKIENLDYELYITGNHPMKKEDYISFSVINSNSKTEIFSHYPEWNYELRIPPMGRANLYWYSKKAGLKHQLIKS